MYCKQNKTCFIHKSYRTQFMLILSHFLHDFYHFLFISLSQIICFIFSRIIFIIVFITIIFFIRILVFVSRRSTARASPALPSRHRQSHATGLPPPALPTSHGPSEGNANAEKPFVCAMNPRSASETPEMRFAISNNTQNQAKITFIFRTPCDILSYLFRSQQPRRGRFPVRRERSKTRRPHGLRGNISPKTTHSHNNPPKPQNWRHQQ